MLHVAVDADASAAMVGVAQLVEHLVVVQDVAGSSPVTHPMWARFKLSTRGTTLVPVLNLVLFVLRLSRPVRRIAPAPWIA